MIRQRWLKPALLTIAALVVLFVLVARLIPDKPGSESLPEFTQDSIDERKQAFFDYLRPIVRYYNERILDEREWLLKLADSGSPGWFQRRQLRELAEKYRVDMESLDEADVITVLRRRVDAIPESLVLVQAAKESGWGGSRFAREGNAIFGQWCFTAGCGLVPGNRGAGLRHEVQSFETAGESVESYLRNLNTHERYIGMRQARQRIRQEEREVTGSELAAHLDDYSERREAYVAELQAMIRQNNLESD